MGHLNFGENRLIGTLPLGLLSSLDFISFNENRLLGFIPTELCSITTLTGMHLGSNALIGMIPSELGLAFSLRQIHLEENQLTGTIPPELGLLASATETLVHLSPGYLEPYHLVSVCSTTGWDFGLSALRVSADVLVVVALEKGHHRLQRKPDSGPIAGHRIG